MRVVLEREPDRLRRLREIDHADLVTRRHHSTDRQVAEPHHTRDHFLLARLQHAGVFRLDDERADFILAHFLLGVAALAEQPEQRLAGTIENPDQRQGYFGEHDHRGRDLHGHRLGIAQCNLLRHQFADDERRIRDQSHHCADADRVGDRLRQSECFQPLRGTRAERRARKRAGCHADQCDTDLDGRQKFSGVGCESERATRTAHALFDESHQPRGPT